MKKTLISLFALALAFIFGAAQAADAPAKKDAKPAAEAKKDDKKAAEGKKDEKKKDEKKAEPAKK